MAKSLVAATTAVLVSVLSFVVALVKSATKLIEFIEAFLRR